MPLIGLGYRRGTNIHYRRARLPVAFGKQLFLVEESVGKALREPMSSVSTLGLPRRLGASASSAGSNQAPVGIMATRRASKRLCGSARTS
jgi:hypothetical protein